MKKYNRLSLCSYLDTIVQCPAAAKEIEENENGPCEAIPEMELEETIQSNVSSKAELPECLGLSQQNSSVSTKKSFPIVARNNFSEDFKLGNVSDEEIDQNFKMILRRRDNGTYLTAEVTAHLEYFYNTLNLGHKSKTLNPFAKLNDYPALLFKGQSKATSFSANLLKSKNSCQSSDEEDDIMMDDNDLIDEVAVHDQFLKAKNSTPEQQAAKKIDVGRIRRASYRDDIIKQSSIYIDQLSVLDKSKLLMKPHQHL